MKTFDLRKDDFSQIISESVKCLARPGAVLLVPTETVYGLVCRAADKDGVRRIYEIKKRSETKPLALFVHKTAMLKNFVPEMPRTAEKLADAFCPGPITLIVPDNKGGKTGFRIPDFEFILKLVKELGEPLASTSANRSGNPAALCVEDALADFDGTPDICIDYGHLPKDSKASTVIDVCADSRYKILRPGPVTEEMIQECLK